MMADPPLMTAARMPAETLRFSFFGFVDGALTSARSMHVDLYRDVPEPQATIGPALVACP